MVMAVYVVPLNCKSLSCRGEERHVQWEGLHVQWEEFLLLVRHSSICLLPSLSIGSYMYMVLEQLILCKVYWNTIVTYVHVCTYTTIPGTI